MSDKKISDLVELTTLAADDVLPVVDASANATKRITGANLSNFPTQPTFDGNDVYHQGNVVGTVSESSGDVTGAIIERDSNSNGEYVKYADGTLVCFFAQAFGTISGNSSAEFTWTYPESFTSAPTLIAATETGSGNPANPPRVTAAVRSGPGTASALICAFNFSGVTLAPDAHLLAIGRWF